MKLLIVSVFMPLIVACASSSAPQLVRAVENPGVVVWSYIPGSNMVGHDVLSFFHVNDSYCKSMGYAGVVIEGSYTDRGLLRSTTYYPCISQAELSVYGARFEGGFIFLNAPYMKAVNYANARNVEAQYGTQLLQSLDSQLQQQSNRHSQQYEHSGGVLTSETMSGVNKICYYNKLGSVYAVTIRATQICPLSN